MSKHFLPAISIAKSSVRFPCVENIDGRFADRWDGRLKLSQKPAVRDNRGTPPHPNPLPRSGGEEILSAPSPSGRGLG